MLYKYLKKILFCFPAEKAHKLAIVCLDKIPSSWFLPLPELPINVFGLYFKNPIGLAAGFDKNGDYIDTLGKLGFGFIEVGTITPLPQPGNPKPRLFRLNKSHALINRMGFNNKGVDYLVERLKQCQYKGIIGVNIGKNAFTPLEEAVEDYLICLKKVYSYADYITINVSSPNTPHLRELQESEYLNRLLLAVSDIRSILEKEQGVHKPILLKISPDETPETLEAIAHAVLHHKIDGIIATNTTINKSKVATLQHGQEAGGLSGSPLLTSSNQTLKTLYALLGNKVPLIGVGGIMKSSEIREKLNSGAKLIQVYTGLIYHGPFWIKHLLKILSKKNQ